jgi:hypothetical protein
LSVARVGLIDRSNFGSIDFVSRTDARKIAIGASGSVAFAGLRLPGDLGPCKKSEGDEVHLVHTGRKDPEYNDGSAFLIPKIKRSTP